MKKFNLTTGKIGEKIASKELIKRGYQIIGQNYRTRFGEIDIIAKDCEIWVFVEVKARKGTGFGLPQEAVNFRKQNKIIRSAIQYIQQNRLGEISWRVDVVSILLDRVGNVKKFDLIKNAVMR